MTTLMTAKQVEKIRKKLGLTQSQFARQLGVNRSSVCYWENGGREVSQMAAKFIHLLESLNERGIKHE